jgi:hypothetical protein
VWGIDQNGSLCAERQCNLTIIGISIPDLYNYFETRKLRELCHGEIICWFYPSRSSSSSKKLISFITVPFMLLFFFLSGSLAHTRERTTTIVSKSLKALMMD